MTRTHTFHLALVLVVGTATAGVTGCTDPAKDAPKAVVTEAPAPAPAPATPTPPPATDGAAAAAPAAAGDFAFSNEGSSISFVGAKVTGKHEGVIKSFTGTIDSKAPAVAVELDMKSLATEPAKLEAHLKSPDFFDVDKFPTASFKSATIKDGTVTGDLTLHGVTKRISFPAKLTISGDAAAATAEFSINRKDFGLVYPGKPDDLIRDDVLIKLDIKAKKS